MPELYFDPSLYEMYFHFISIAFLLCSLSIFLWRKVCWFFISRTGLFKVYQGNYKNRAYYDGEIYNALPSFIIRKDKVKSNSSKYSRHLSRISKTWVLKSNNKSYGDEDIYCHIDNIDAEIVKMLKYSDFVWVQKYLESESYGVVRSHASSDFSKIEIKFNQSQLVCRNHELKLSKWEKKLISKITELEIKYEKPFEVYFGLTKNKVTIIEISEQKLSRKLDHGHYSLARSINGEYSDNFSMSYMGSSLIYSLMNNYLFYGKSHSVSNIKQSTDTINMDEAYSQLMAIKMCREFQHMEISELLSQLKDRMNYIAKFNIESSINHMDLLKEINSSFYCLSTNMDICSKERLYFDNIIDSESSQKACIDFLLYVSTNIVREKIISLQFDMGYRDFQIKDLSDMSISSYLKGIR